MLGGPSGINRGKNLISVDTGFGIAVHPAAGTSELLDSISIGEITDNEDCPEGSPCDHCISRRGMVLPVGADDGHKDFVPKYSKFPLFGGGGSAKGYVRRHTFKYYNSTTTTCGSKQRAIQPLLDPDYTPYAEIFSPDFIDVIDEAMTFLEDPP